MIKFYALASLIAIGAATVTPAHARGGWDGNGRSVNGIDQSAIGLAQPNLQVNRCATGGAETQSQLRYVEFPAVIGNERQPRLDVASSCLAN